MTEKRPVGRPREYNDPELFAAKAGEYFSQVEADNKVPNLAGLCLHMGFSDRDSFTRYAEYGEDFSRTVKAVKMRMENDRVQRLHSGNATGPIFDLKVNYGWQDKSVAEVSGPNGGSVQVNVTGLSESALAEIARLQVEGE